MKGFVTVAVEGADKLIQSVDAHGNVLQRLSAGSSTSGHKEVRSYDPATGRTVEPSNRRTVEPSNRRTVGKSSTAIHTLRQTLFPE